MWENRTKEKKKKNFEVPLMPTHTPRFLCISNPAISLSLWQLIIDTEFIVVLWNVCNIDNYTSYKETNKKISDLIVYIVTTYDWLPNQNFSPIE